MEDTKNMACCTPLSRKFINIHFTYDYLCSNTKKRIKFKSSRMQFGININNLACSNPLKYQSEYGGDCMSKI